jgi:HK97 family phage major capsid protein
MRKTTIFLTNILFFALAGALICGIGFQSPDAALAGAAAFQGLHFVSIPYGVAGDLTVTSIKGIKDQMGTIHKRMDATIKKAETEKRDLTKEETDQYDADEVEFNSLEAKLKRLEKAEERSKSMLSFKPATTDVQDDVSEAEKRNFSGFSIVRGLQLMAEGRQLDGVEKEVHEIASKEARDSGLKIAGFAVPAYLPGSKPEQRGQTATGQTSAAGDQGGVSVATEVNQLIEALWANNFLSLVGATRFAGLVGNQTFPVQSSKPAAESPTEIAALTDQEILFSKVDMTPNRRGATIPISKQLLLQSSFDVQKFVINQIVKSLDYKLNADAITAVLAAIISGNGNLLALGTNGLAPTYVDAVALETLIAASDADKAGIKYLTNSKVRGKYKLTQKFASTNGDPVWEKGNEINGYPAVVSNIVPSNLTKGTSSGVCSAIVLGNFADLYVGMWGGTDFVVDPYTKAKQAEVEITANMFWDVEVARAASFAGIKDALTT